MEVAVKRIMDMHRDHAETPEDLIELTEQFRKEGKTLSSLHHENIVRYFGAATDPDGLPLLVMEYCEGGNLRRLLMQRESAGLHVREMLHFAFDCARVCHACRLL